MGTHTQRPELEGPWPSQVREQEGCLWEEGAGELPSVRQVKPEREERKAVFRQVWGPASFTYDRPEAPGRTGPWRQLGLGLSQSSEQPSALVEMQIPRPRRGRQNEKFRGWDPAIRASHGPAGNSEVR